MTVRLSVAVMAHPSRAVMVEDLVARLGADVPVVWDEINDRHDTGIRAIQAADPDSTHHLVIQDDALPCRDFLAGTVAALAQVPADHPVSLYLGTVKPFGPAVRRVLARAQPGTAWVRMGGPYWGPAIVLPTVDVPALGDWWIGAGAAWTNYDRRIQRFYASRGIDCLYSWPSLVEHRGDQSIVHPGSSPGRVAHRALTPEQSALDVDWSGPAVELLDSDRLDRQRQRSAERALQGR